MFYWHFSELKFESFSDLSSLHSDMPFYHLQKLVMMCTPDHLSRRLTLFSPYWFVNRTGQDLYYRDSSSKDEEILPHTAAYAKPYLFCFNKISSVNEKVSI